MPVRAILQPSDGILRKLRSATNWPRSSVRELICVSDKISVCAIECAKFEVRMGPYPNWRQVARKRIVTENADFDHHSLAAVATISAQSPALADPRERTFVSPEQ